MRSRPMAQALTALVVLVAITIGVPVLLVATVGNPWPGRVAVELGDSARLVIGVLAALAWILWARFVIALGVEAARQLDARRSASTPTAATRTPVAPPPAGGFGLLAHHLVAAVLILLPAMQSTAVAAPSAPLPTPMAHVEQLEQAAVSPPHEAAAESTTPEAGPRARHREIVVTPGDTLIRLARAHLGQGERWREIFELNRDRTQPDGGRMTSPSVVRVGWMLRLPLDAAPADEPASPLREPAAAYVEPETVTIQAGDNLWSLSEARLGQAGVDNPSATMQYVDAVVAANAAVVEDPNLIYPGERFQFPAVGTPPAAPRVGPDRVPEEPTDEASVVSSPPTTDEPAPSTTDVEPPPAQQPAGPETSTTTTSPPAAPVAPEPPPAEVPVPSPSPSPLGLGEVALVSTGVLGLLAARRRARLRGSRPRARVPEPRHDSVVTERLLRAVDSTERLLRVDVAVRAAALSLIEGPSQIAVVMAGTDGEIELVLTSPGRLPAPWTGDDHRWVLPGATPIELLADAARSVGTPCLALVPVGVALDGRDVLVDLEALGVLAVAADRTLADVVVNGIASSLASSLFAESVNVVAVGVPSAALLGHSRTSFEPTLDEAITLAVTLAGTTVATRHSTFALRARHTSGEAWEPAVVIVAADQAVAINDAAVPVAARRRPGVAMVLGASVPAARWSIRADAAQWTLEPLGLPLTPVGLRADELDALNDALELADQPLVDDEPLNADELDDEIDTDGLAALVGDPVTLNGAREQEPERGDAEFVATDWSLMARVLGPVDVVDHSARPAAFDRAKAQELVVWLALHRERSTRCAARTALWELDVRDATFANIVSDARRAMARLVDPAPGQEWLGRTLTDMLPLHPGVLTDADVVRARLDHARLQPPELAIDTLRPAVELIRGLPFEGTGYLWPDAEGTTSNLVLLATSAATELAGHHLSMGDIDGVFWATGQGLRVLPGHEELIGLRMRAHAQAGDLAGVRQEWESYERVLHADPWSGGEPAEKLAVLRRELLS